MAEIVREYFSIEEALKRDPDATRVADWIEYERHTMLPFALSRVRTMVERGDASPDTLRIVRVQVLPFTFGVDGKPVAAS